MKKIYAFIATSLVATSFFFVQKQDSKSFFARNVEALTQNEGAIIVCDSGVCGQCLEEESAWPFYKCNWTGRQEDFCECDRPGFIG